MKKYNYIDSDKICLFASEISIITGDNKFKNLGEIIFRIWKLNFNKDFLKYKNIYEENKDVFKNDKEKLSDFISKYNILSKLYYLVYLFPHFLYFRVCMNSGIWFI